MDGRGTRQAMQHTGPDAVAVVDILAEHFMVAASRLARPRQYRYWSPYNSRGIVVLGFLSFDPSPKLRP